MKIIGWDIGGAHIKAVKIDFEKKNQKRSKYIALYGKIQTI